MCGLTGFYPIGSGKADIYKLALIAVGNEERGKDNTGIAVGNDYFNKTASGVVARDFISAEIATLKKLNLNQPVIIHTRQASQRYNLAKTSAHPFHWSKDDYYFVGAHNGTVTNTYKLHKDFLESIRNRKHTDYSVDSELVLDCILTSLWDKKSIGPVLQAYEGAAALLFYDNNNFYAWKGANNGTEERPLWCAKTREGYYFSSIPSLLRIISNDVKIIGDNTLTIFNTSGITTEVFERKNSVATPHTQVTSTNNNYGYPFLDGAGRWCVSSLKNGKSGSRANGELYGNTETYSWINGTKFNSREINFLQGIRLEMKPTSEFCRVLEKVLAKKSKNLSKNEQTTLREFIADDFLTIPARGQVLDLRTGFVYLKKNESIETRVFGTKIKITKTQNSYEIAND